MPHSLCASFAYNWVAGVFSLCITIVHTVKYGNGLKSVSIDVNTKSYDSSFLASLTKVCNGDVMEIVYISQTSHPAMPSPPFPRSVEYSLLIFF